MPDTQVTAARVPRLSYFFPAHNEEANLEGLVIEALETLPTLAEIFEIIAVDDGSRDGTPAIADALAAAHPDVVRVVHHPTNLGYGAALRSGFGAARYDLVAFTDGDRQFKVADLGRLTARIVESDRPDVVVGFRIKRADPLIRTLYARAYRLANRIFFGLKVTDVDCACKLFRREALEGLRVESGGAFFSAEMIIKLRAAGKTVVEVGRPALPADRRLGDRRQTIRGRSGPSATSGCCASGCGRIAAGRCGAASRWCGRRGRRDGARTSSFDAPGLHRNALDMAGADARRRPATWAGDRPLRALGSVGESDCDGLQQIVATTVPVPGCPGFAS